MNTLIQFDRDVAEVLWGWRPGRPTISRRAGELISRVTGMSPELGTDLFHIGLVVAGLSLLQKKGR